MPVDIFKGKIDYLVNYLQGQTRIIESEEIFVPGEIEVNKEKRQLRKELYSMIMVLKLWKN